MQRRLVPSIVLLAALRTVTPVLAQEGHPLTGTWFGDWGPTAADRTRLTVVMSWDGKRVTGTINPGPGAIPIGSVFLDLTSWSVRIEADGKDQSGNPTHIAAEGRLEELGSTHRRLVGTWQQGTVKGTFRITRD
jgi:hypothetical protein